MQLQKGQKIKFSDLGISSNFVAECNVKSALTIDVSCFCLNENSKLEDEKYMIFYNQKISPNKEIKLIQESPSFKFEVDADKLPVKASKLVFIAAIDGEQTLSEIQSVQFKIADITFELSGKDFAKEKAIIIAEVYKKDNVWRVNAVGQGFNGGLDALIVSFGGEVAPNQNFPAEKTKQALFLEKRVSLEKNIEKTAPKLVSLTKKAALSLEKRGLGQHRARVALCLDISYSMSSMYNNGLIQNFVERILALGCRLDDDGSIDVFLFGKGAYQAESISIQDFSGYVNRTIKSYPLEGDTKYGTAIELVRKFYTPYQYERSEPHKQELPIYVMFLTDGQPTDKAQSTRALKNSSYEPIFWQFMGVGDTNFSYLEKLDDLPGRYIDNADFFSVSSLNFMSDDILYESITNEYPSWLKQAKIKNLID